MSDRRKGLLVLLLMFGIMMMLAGITGIVSRTEEYEYPIYISQEFKLFGTSSKELTGQFTNRTSENVVIEEMSIRVSTEKKGNTRYYDYLKFKNIIVPANGVYNFKQIGIVSSFVNVSLSYCIIDGERCSLKYSNDGIVFEDNEKQLSSSILYLIGGVVLLGLSAFVITDYFVKKRNVKY